MKNLLFTLFACAISTCHAQTHEPFLRVHLATSLGIGISGRPEEMSGGAFMANLAIPLEFRMQWYVIPEIYSSAFRSPNYPNKVGFFNAYPRINYMVYSVRMAKGIKITSKSIIQMSVGGESLSISEPCCSNSWFGNTYKSYRIFAIPAQFDARFQLNNKGIAFWTINARVDINKHRSFGSLNTGIDVRFLSL